ncbi:hypothetical protein ACFFX0_24130 [Citricoccus parietis]|uniref:Integron gene cassette protein n=1 Tax=Citricoccus parietis TaxID=592307 RepID=A0ABV5G589_9MICC
MPNFRPRCSRYSLQAVNISRTLRESAVAFRARSSASTFWLRRLSAGGTNVPRAFSDLAMSRAARASPMV